MLFAFEHAVETHVNVGLGFDEFFEFLHTRDELFIGAGVALVLDKRLEPVSEVFVAGRKPATSTKYVGEGVRVGRHGNRGRMALGEKEVCCCGCTLRSLYRLDIWKASFYTSKPLRAGKLSSGGSVSLLRMDPQ